MVEEDADERCVEVVDVQFRRLQASTRGRKYQQQPQGVAIGGERMRAGLALTNQTVGEERLQGRGEDGHASPPRWRSRRSLAKIISSGAAERYQYVLPGSM